MPYYCKKCGVYKVNDLKKKKKDYFFYVFRPEEPPLQNDLFSDNGDYLGTRSICCSDKTAKLCACVEKRISLLANMLSELYFEDEDQWALRQHQGNCCNKFTIRFVKFFIFNSSISKI